MANKKFSEFTLENAPGEGVFVVGYIAGVNIRMPIAAFLGAFIPLSGTEVGKPVTGDVRVQDDLYWKLANNQQEIVFNDDGSGMQIIANGGGEQGILNVVSNAVTVSSSDLTSRGISGQQDFTPNIGPLDYVQYKLLPKVADNYANDAAAAVGGIAVGAMYHTSGAVKIRLS